MPLRKICLTCLESILDISPDGSAGGASVGSGSRLDVSALLQVMPLVLADKDELKMQAHQVREVTYSM